MIFDEASQAKDIDVAQPWLIINSRRAVLANDEKQLAPYIETDLALLINGRSLFEKLKERQGFPNYMLKMQYRTRANIYADANYLYIEEIESHPFTDNRPFYNHPIFTG